MRNLSLADPAFLAKDAGGFDANALAYLSAVESADGQALEQTVSTAINAFVVGCKTDEIWSAIKACCILAGARTLTGALVPLVGTAPTNNGPFVSSDYNRKTGLIGNRSSKWLNSNRAGNADPQNNTHAAIYVSAADIAEAIGYMGTSNTAAGSTNLVRNNATTMAYRCQASSFATATPGTPTGLIAVSRNSSTAFTYRANGASGTTTISSQIPNSTNYGIFSLGDGAFPSAPRLAFYSIGESLNLALLDARVTTLINALAAAIP